MVEHSQQRYNILHVGLISTLTSIPGSDILNFDYGGKNDCVHKQHAVPVYCMAQFSLKQYMTEE